MPITLIKNTKDNAMHGTDNDRYTGCRMKMQGGNWYTREGELKDITDLTCERCKEVFATKMIRESNREEARLAKEEKKRYQKAKKQGSVREATYEEYVLNRESEASAKRDSKDDEAVSASLHMLKDAIPTPEVQQPVTGSVQFQSPFSPYNQPAQTAPPQNMFNPYAQQSQSQIVPPQNMFNPYAQQSQSQVVPPQNMFNPYAQQSQSQVVPPQQNMFDPYAQQSSVSQNVQSGLNQGDTAQFSVPQFGSQPTEPEQPVVDEGPAPSYQEYIKGSFGMDTSSSASEPVSKSVSSSDDDFLAQFMINKTPEPAVQETLAPSVTASNILSATDDILSQFNIGAQKAETVSNPAPVNEVKADASAFYSNNIPVVGAEYAGADSVNSVTTEFGSLNIVEPPKDEFVVPDVPVYQPSSSGYANANMASQISSLEDLTVPDVSSLKPASSASNYSLQFAELASADVQHSTSAENDIEEIGLADIESDFGFGQLTSESEPLENTSDSEVEDFMSGFDDIPAVPTMNSFDTITPVQPAVPTMNSFDTVAPVQPASPTMNSFETITPVQPAAPTMNSFETITPVQPASPTMNSFDTITPVQPTVPTMNSFDTVAPVQPAAPTMNSFETITPVQPAAPTTNSFETVPPVQPAAPTMNSFNTVPPVQPAAPVMNSFNTVPPVQQPVNNYNQPVQNNPYAMPQTNNYAQSGMYQQPVANNNMSGYNPYAAPQTPSFQMPQQQTNVFGGVPQQPAAAPVRKAPAPAVFEQGNTADSIEEALRQLGLDVATPEEKMQNEKEEIVPDFVAYVPSSSKVLHAAPPSNSAANAPKRPISAKEAKQLAKIDAKFKKDLISRGFNPNELKSQRRGK